MYLRRLELYGFKTFADRTELEFGPGITAIVGPNGSGKSNISDAILWVLGEQAMKSLRSTKSTDVIFKGSDARKALGMAEVHLTLDNSSGLLATDFTEVSVSRRVFRSGESEYLINRVPVRLRDVQDLFLDTGIGKQSYSIISQGEVDAVLSSRSEERRALFEEVAGISKYKQRKKEALRKLEQTRLHLLRVSDIISELETQIGPLATQSEQARQYQIYHGELTELHLALLVLQYQGLQGSLARTKEREEELHREMEGLRHALQQLEIKETTLRAEVQKLEDELDERRQLESRFAGAAQAAESKLQLLRQQEESARGEMERLAREREEWQRQSDRFDEDMRAARAEEARLQGVIAEIDAGIAAVDAELKEADAALSETARLMQERRGIYLELLDRLARVRNDLTRAESLLRTSENRTARITAEREEIEGKLAERRQALAAALAQVAERQAQRTALIAQRTEAGRARQRAAEAQAALRREEHAVREELAGARSRLRTLHELEESLEGYFPGVRAVAAAATNGTLRGWYAPAADLLDVPAGLETAIETALGAHLQDVVTDTEQAAREAVNFLKRNNAGRATFLPLDLIAPAPPAAVPSRPGVRGLAVDLVRFDARYAPAMQHLLGRVIVADDLDAALALAKSGEAKGWSRIVTLEGEVVYPSRAITGGAAGGSGGLLKRKREVQELTETVRRLEGAASAVQRKSQEAAADVQRLDAELAALAKASEQAATAVSESERLAATIQRDVAAHEERAAALAEEAAWVGAEIDTARGEAQRFQAQADALEVEQRAAETTIAEAEQQLAGGQSLRNDITERYGTLRLRLTEARGALHAGQAAQLRTVQLRDALAERLAANLGAEEELRQRLATLAAEQQEAGEEMARLRDAHARSTGDLAAARDRRTALLEDVAANLEAQKAGRAAIEECQGRLHRTDLRATQVETELGFLQGQFLDEYRLTPDQAAARARPVEQRAVAIARLKELQALIEEMGTVNLGAIEEYDRIRERLTFLTAQRADLEASREDLARVIAEIDATCTEKFLDAFAAIAHEFQDLFTRLFGGGTTELTLADPSDVLESGIEIHVTIPGRRNQHLLQLSGGERALTALALLFAMLRIKPSPFVVLDEIDAPLDEANIGRYCEVLRDFTADTQFLIITHNKGTMEAADVLYGVTMQKAGVSQIVSVRLTEGHAMAATSG